LASTKSMARLLAARVGRTMADDRNKDWEQDEIDRVLAHANPNPRRIGCLPAEVLESLALRKQPLSAPGYEHLLECSECYRQFRAHQRGGPGTS
jgi:hypothetical protein